jgi:hypothetical protein
MLAGKSTALLETLNLSMSSKVNGFEFACEGRPLHKFVNTDKVKYHQEARNGTADEDGQWTVYTEQMNESSWAENVFCS